MAQATGAAGDTAVVRVVRRDPETRAVLWNREGYRRLGYDEPQDCTVEVARDGQGGLPRTIRIRVRSHHEGTGAWAELELSGLHGAPPVYVERP